MMIHPRFHELGDVLISVALTGLRFRFASKLRLVGRDSLNALEGNTLLSDTKPLLHC